MSESVIGDRLEKETQPDDGALPQRTLYDTARDQRPLHSRDLDDNKIQTDFMSDLVDSQQTLIGAYHRCLHDSNMGALAAAQHGHLQVVARVLERLRVFG